MSATLKPLKRALIVIDVQNEYVSGKLRIEYPPVQESLANIGMAMDTAYAAKIPIVVVQHDESESAPIFAKGSTSWELHPVVAKRPRTRLINKSMTSVFAETDFAQWLANNEIDTLTIVGYMTHNCNAAAIYHAKHAGFAVELLADATGALSYHNDAGSATAEEIQRVFNVVFHSNFAAVQKTADWIAAVNNGVATQRGGILASNQRALATVSS
ncbi:MAG TPA: cysteine hydrolase family protein [Burkholderiaceae bacterium]|jgi:nicotinamidase-related amidase|nr:cysteine hydrolase family protein [Burkholderiaceae bacterium]